MRYLECFAASVKSKIQQKNFVALYNCFEENTYAFVISRYIYKYRQLTTFLLYLSGTNIFLLFILVLSVERLLNYLEAFRNKLRTYVSVGPLKLIISVFHVYN